jgi:hypothetical protein
MTTNRSRRRFLRDALLVGGGAACFGAAGLTVQSLLARAAGGPGMGDCYYVFCYFGGGWDVLLGLDPRDPARFPEDSIADHRIMPGYDRLVGSDGMLVRASDTMTFGPFIGDLASHPDKIAVVRGMSMDTLTHEVGFRRFLTGKPPSGLQARGSSAATWLASELGEAEVIPQLAIGVESYNNDGLPPYASAVRLGAATDLLAVLQRAEPLLPEQSDREIDAFLAEEAECDRHRHSQVLRDGEAGRLRARELLDRELYRYFDLRSAELEPLRSHYGITTDFGGAEAQAAIAAQAIMNGVSRVVSIVAAGGLDTHFGDWATNQGPRQRRGFNAVARLIEHLDRTEHPSGGSWLDRTTIIGFSEFMRTPLLNEAGGRDHWLTNACFLAGGNVRGGTVVGASSDIGMSPQEVDLASGRVDPGGEVIRPEHVLRTLMVDAGITGDVADLRVPPVPALLRA